MSMRMGNAELNGAEGKYPTVGPNNRTARLQYGEQWTNTAS